MDDLKCGICLELFQDPRSLPCLHTFCRECIQRSLNEENHSLKCPVCRAKHELSEGAGLLPVNQYALQELPLKRLQQQREDNGGLGQLVECKSCGEKAAMVAWCYDCDAMICQPCEASHKKLAIFRGHRVVKKAIEGENEADARMSSARMAIPKCLNHTDQNLKHFCIPCSELVCSDCLLTGSHAGHEHSLIEEARHSLENEMEELGIVVKEKNEQFSKYLEKASGVEVKALEYSELMKSEVNNVFDGIIASVEAQRNEALQKVSHGVKKIWSQKEMMEVGLAQLDSFTRFADHTSKCTTDASFVAMATQGVKLMSKVKSVQGDESALNLNMVAILPLCRDDEDSRLHVDLDELFILGLPSLLFSPSPESGIVNGTEESIIVSLMMRGKPIYSEYLSKKCNLNVSMYWSTKPVKPADDELSKDKESEHSAEQDGGSSSADSDDDEPFKLRKMREMTLSSDSEEEPNHSDDGESQEDGSSLPNEKEGHVALNLLPSSFDNSIAEIMSFTEEDAIEIECSVELHDDSESDELDWVINANLRCSKKGYQSLVIRCKLSGAISSETIEIRMELLNNDEDDESSSDDDDALL